jgi:peptidoglycan/xylan/chitin deacetylase (PgdA/CDA1 family)
VVLTFDDGYENLFWNVYPVLSEFGFTATVFLVSGFCGKLNHWAGQPGGIPSLKLLNWQQIREMDGKCIEFGAHSVSHQRLDRLSEIELDMEILQSKTDIEDHLGQGVNVFAYPYGAHNAQVKAVTASSFDGAYGTAMGYLASDSDPFLMERIDIYYFKQSVLFQRLFSPSGNFITALLRRYRKIRSHWAEPDGY